MEEENTPILKKTSTRLCPHCHQDVEVNVGLSGENFKKLFRKPTMEEWITLFILIMAVTLFFVYRADINAYETYMETNCTCTHDYAKQNQDPDLFPLELNIFQIDVTNDNKENQESG